ncbi:MAG: hypothetical protein Q7R31_03835 [Candidatus Levybacteria bacterium]|nr:hypothetical protein [Candidatus Levybacteria bacterium]
MVERIEALERVLEQRRVSDKEAYVSKLAGDVLPTLWDETLNFLKRFRQRSDLRINLGGWDGIKISNQIGYKGEEIILEITHCVQQAEKNRAEEYMIFRIEHKELVGIRLFKVGKDKHFVIDDKVRKGRGLPPVNPQDIIDLSEIIPTLGKRCL